MFDPELEINARLNNQQICEVFGCSPQGGMRRSKKTNSLVLVSNHYTSIYEDRWVDGLLHYTGMGQSGDQDLNWSQNRTLNESRSNGVSVHLFEVFGPKGTDYHYRGRVVLAGDPYQESQLDEHSESRLVWVFPLRPLDSTGEPDLSANELSSLQNHRRSLASKMTDSQLTNRLLSKPVLVGKTSVTSSVFHRDPLVIEYAKRRAEGRCELCDSQAPFLDKQGVPFLEVHHIVWLSKGGPDAIQNVAALCPNCHRRMHSLDDRQDIKKLLAIRSNDSV